MVEIFPRTAVGFAVAAVEESAEVALAGDWSLQGELRNVFDRRYETAAYYNQPGREWGLSVRWRPSH